MDGEFSLARMDSASRRARWQQMKIQVPRMLFSGQMIRGGLFWILFWAVAKEYLASGARPAIYQDKDNVR